MAIDELEFLVHFNRTLCISLPSEDASLASLRQHVQDREGVPADRLEFSVNGVKLGADDELPRVPAMLRARMTDGLLGGKGGFGAMLRSQGKGASSKATTSFGACRDLNGRRLRHVNQEIAMEKWRQEGDLREQRKKQGITEREVMDEETASGIAGWYLATPSWAEGITKSYMKRRRNTTMCTHWLKARENGRSAPPNAPRWWGCPRGRDCDFAHGEQELRGEGLTEYKRQKKDEQYQKKQQELHMYVNYEHELPTDIHDAIRQGMRNRSRKAAGSTGETKPANTELLLEQLAMEEISSPTSVTIPEQWLTPVANSVVATFKHGLCELRGAGNFGTAMVGACAITQGKWYYEVRLVTDGIIQLGWADRSFSADSETGDGVGDHARSWAYDGARQLKWNGGKEAPYGQDWQSGDIIGCLLDADAATIAFSRNGELLGDAFTCITSASKASKSSGLFPAISMEKTEILLINIGAQPFLYAPPDYQPVAQLIQIARKKDEEPKPKPTSASTPASTPAEPSKQQAVGKEQEQETSPVEPMDLDTFKSVDALEKLGLEVLKQQLQARKLKCGGTLTERASRLLSTKGKSWEEIDPKIKDFKALQKSYE